MGCVVFAGDIPERIEEGIVGSGFPIEVYNVLGAGDAFLAGFLRGWLRGEPLKTCATWANAMRRDCRVAAPVLPGVSQLHGARIFS